MKNTTSEAGTTADSKTSTPTTTGKKIETPAVAPADASGPNAPSDKTENNVDGHNLAHHANDSKLAPAVAPPLVEQARISSLKFHPLNSKYYGAPKTNPRLKDSIAAVGVLQPLIVNGDTVLQGNNRLFAAIELGMTEIPVIRVKISDPVDELEMLLTGNMQRDKTNEERAREFQGFLHIETQRAKRRQATNTSDSDSVKATKSEAVAKPGANKRKKPQLVEDSSHADSGKARDIAAAKVAWSGLTAANAAKVLTVIDAETRKDPSSEVAQTLTEKLNESVNGAFAECKRLGLLEEAGGKLKKEKSGSLHAEGFMPPERPYASHTFVPTTESFKLNEKAMASLAGTNPKRSGEQALLPSIVTLPQSTDLFDVNYTDDVIGDFAEGLEKAKQWVCLIETKYGERAKKFIWPENAFIGLAVSTQKEVNAAVETVADFPADHVWLHCQLDSEFLSVDRPDAFDWIVVSTVRDVSWEDVEPILLQARQAKVPVYFDSSVQCRPQQLPKRTMA